MERGASETHAHVVQMHAFRYATHAWGEPRVSICNRPCEHQTDSGYFL